MIRLRSRAHLAAAALLAAAAAAPSGASAGAAERIAGLLRDAHGPGATVEVALDRCQFDVSVDAVTHGSNALAIAGPFRSRTLLRVSLPHYQLKEARLTPFGTGAGHALTAPRKPLNKTMEKAVLRAANLVRASAPAGKFPKDDAPLLKALERPDQKVSINMSVLVPGPDGRMTAAPHADGPRYHDMLAAIAAAEAPVSAYTTAAWQGDGAPEREGFLVGALIFGRALELRFRDKAQAAEAGRVLMAYARVNCPGAMF